MFDDRRPRTLTRLMKQRGPDKRVGILLYIIVNEEDSITRLIYECRL